MKGRLAAGILAMVSILSSNSSPERSRSAAEGAPEVPSEVEPTPVLLPPPAGSRGAQLGFALGAAAVGLITLLLLRDVLGAFVLGGLIAFLIGPIVDRVGQIVPRPLAILLTLTALIAVMVLLVQAVAPLVTAQVDQLRVRAPGLAATAQSQLSRLDGERLDVLGRPIDLSRLATSAVDSGNQLLLGQFGNAVGIGLAAIGTVLQLALMLVVAFLVALDSHRISNVLRRLVPYAYRTDFDGIWTETKSMLFGYMRGQVTVAALIGLLVGVATSLLGLPYALALGLLAGILALVPYLGPILGGVAPVLLALASGPQQALIVAIVYIVISNVVLNLVYPRVVGAAVRLPALLVIVALLAGFGLAGILGMFVAVPIAGTLRIVFDHVHPRLYGPAGAANA